MVIIVPGLGVLDGETDAVELALTLGETLDDSDGLTDGELSYKLAVSFPFRINNHTPPTTTAITIIPAKTFFMDILFKI